jgi:hypothetical protein
MVAAGRRNARIVSDDLWARVQGRRAEVRATLPADGPTLSLLKTSSRIARHRRRWFEWNFAAQIGETRYAAELERRQCELHRVQEQRHVLHLLLRGAVVEPRPAELSRPSHPRVGERVNVYSSILGTIFDRDEQTVRGRVRPIVDFILASQTGKLRLGEAVIAID